jgi:hypothetical protein
VGYRSRHLAAVQVGAFERIPSPLTVACDLGKRRSAQRLALDTWVENARSPTASSQVTDTVDAALAPSAEQWTALGPCCAAHFHPPGWATGP